MKPPRTRFTILRLMWAIALVALAIGAEVNFFGWAMALTRGPHDGKGFRAGVIQLWFLMNVPAFFLACFVFLAFRYKLLGRNAPDPPEPE